MRTKRTDRRLRLGKKLQRTGTSAFSLIEIAVSLGIFAFAIVGIMGLFPAALQQSAESSALTRGSFIANAILAELRTGPPGRRIVSSEILQGDDDENGDERLEVAIDLSQPGEFYFLFNDKGRMVGTATQQEFLEGTLVLDAQYSVRLQVAPVEVVAGGRVPSVAMILFADAEYPATAPSRVRNRFRAFTIVRD